MPIRIIKLGSPRVAGEGLRIGTVRRPPRGVPKSEYARRDLYDVWFPNLSPSEQLLKEYIPVADDAAWRRFRRAFLGEMKAPAPRYDLDLLAALSKDSSFSLGCYCADEHWCHRSLLRELLQARGAQLLGDT